MAAQSATPLLKVEGLKQYFKVNKNFTVKAVDGCMIPPQAKSPSTGRTSAAVCLTPRTTPCAPRCR